MHSTLCRPPRGVNCYCRCLGSVGSFSFSMFLRIAWKGVARANLGSIIGLGNSILVFSYRLCNWPREKRRKEENTWQLRPVDGAINNPRGENWLLRVTWVSPDSGVGVFISKGVGNCQPLCMFLFCFTHRQSQSRLWQVPNMRPTPFSESSHTFLPASSSFPWHPKWQA